MAMNHLSTINRRQFLQTAALGAAGVALGRMPVFAGDAGKAAYGGFKMGIESFSLRNFDLDGCLERMKKLDLHFIEFFFGHIQVTDDAGKLAALKEKCAKYEVTPLGWFVDNFAKDDDFNRARFKFAQALGLKVLVGTPTPECFASLDRLVAEFGIPVAIHNHGPGSAYAKISDVAKALEGRHRLIGACVDTGHFLNADEDPVKAIQTFGERTYEVHLKEVDKNKKFQVLGKGMLDTVGVLRALKKLNFQNCLALEYEENPADPMADMAECLRVVREAVKQI